MRRAEQEFEVLHTIATLLLYALALCMFAFVVGPVFQRGPVAVASAIIVAALIVAFAG